MRRAILCLTLLPLLTMASASPAVASGLDVRLGAFFPRASSNLFMDDEELYIVSKNDWIGFAGGVEYNHVMAKNVELGIHVDGYAKTVETSYRDFVRPDGSEIYQSLRLNILPFGLTVPIVPTTKVSAVASPPGGNSSVWPRSGSASM